MTSPPVHCVHSEMMDISKLKPHPHNPNTHPVEQVDILAKVISSQGWRNPITISSLSGYIVRGHGRWLAAKRLGCMTVPVDVQHYDTESAELADLIADNRIAELAVMNDGMLKDNLLILDVGSFDMELTGFSDESLSALFDAEGEAPILRRHVDDTPPRKRQYFLVVFDVDSIDAASRFIGSLRRTSGVTVYDSKDGQ